MDELDSSIPLKAKILCQPGDTPYEQYTSYISKKYKVVDQQFNITENPTINSISKMNFYKKQSALQLFEDTIIEHGGPDVRVEYQNIGMQKIEHHIERFSRATSGDRTSAIVITNMGDLSFHNIGVLLSLIMSAFCLNPMKTKIGFKF